MRIAVAALSTVILTGTIVTAARAQAPAAGNSADAPRGGQTDEAVQANALYQAQNMVAALPLYEDLHKRHPKENMWRERLAMCLVAANGSDAEMQANRVRAHALLVEARDSGDNSNLLQVLLEKLEARPGPAPAGPESPGLDAFRRAEKTFATGDLTGALKLYEESAAADPKFYEAPLEAGDTEYKRVHYAEAGVWFARAIAIDPNRETAYRYWGDCLMKAGAPAQAEGKFSDALVAEPYSKTPRLGLTQWADLTRTPLASLAITLPPHPKFDVTGAENNYITSATLTIPKPPADGSVAAVWTAYSVVVGMWPSTQFKAHFPAETQYRHSLAEESAGLRAAVAAVKKQNIPPADQDPTTKALLALDADGMLECWILLDHADQGIAQDYVAYRAGHRDVLRAYIAKYEVHPN